MSEKLLLRALSTTTFSTSKDATSWLNPLLWSRKIEDFARANLVVAPLGVQNTELLTRPGEAIRIAKDAAITAAAVADSTSLALQALSYSGITVTPQEYGGAFAITRAELDRAMANLVNEKASNAGYALAKVKDDTIYAALIAGAGSTKYQNAKSAVTSLASTDTFDTTLIADGVTEMRTNNRSPLYLIIHPKYEGRLLKNSNFIDASKYGGRESVLNGEIGRYLGLKVFSTTVASSIAAGTASSHIGYSAMILGPRAFVHAQKRRPTIDSKYEPLDRAFSVAFVEDWGATVLNATEIVNLVAFETSG